MAGEIYEFQDYHPGDFNPAFDSAAGSGGGGGWMDYVPWDQLGSIGASMGNYMADWENPADVAMPTLDNIPETLKPYYEHYMKGGLNPGGRLNEIGAGYQKSPGYDFALQEALKASQHAAAAGGMSGSPQSMYQAEQLATNFANQDYNNYIRDALGVYGQGYQASNSLAQSILDSMLSKALLQYEGAASQNQHEGGAMGGLFGGIGSAVGGIFGGGGGGGGLGGLFSGGGAGGGGGSAGKGNNSFFGKMGKAGVGKMAGGLIGSIWGPVGSTAGSAIGGLVDKQVSK